MVSHHRKHNGSHRGILGNREEVPATHVMYPGRKCNILCNKGQITDTFLFKISIHFRPRKKYLCVC